MVWFFFKNGGGDICTWKYKVFNEGTKGLTLRYLEKNSSQFLQFMHYIYESEYWHCLTLIHLLLSFRKFHGRDRARINWTDMFSKCTQNSCGPYPYLTLFILKYSFPLDIFSQTFAYILTFLLLVGNLQICWVETSLSKVVVETGNLNNSYIYWKTLEIAALSIRQLDIMSK